MKVYVRELGTGLVVKEFDVSGIVGTSSYERFESVLYTKTDLLRYWIDTSEVDATRPAPATGGGQ